MILFSIFFFFLCDGGGGRGRKVGKYQITGVSRFIGMIYRFVLSMVVVTVIVVIMFVENRSIVL